jgi:hypothetical protein
MKKYLFPLLLALAFAGMQYLTVRAANDMYVGEILGVITRKQGDCLRIEGEVLTEAGFPDVRICIDGAPVYDLITGLPVALTEIKTGMSVRAAFLIDDGPEPYPAVVVWLNSCHPEAAVFSAHVSENIRYEGDYCTFLSADGKYRIIFTEDTYIYDPDYGTLSIADILPGQEYFIWVDMITASCPALVYPDKAVRIY